MTIFQLLSDQAVAEGDSNKSDGLGFESYSKVLGDAALGTPGPFNVGVFGEWGTGKTSLLRLTEKYINTNDGVVTVWFNAWRYEKEEHPIVPLLATIIREIEVNKSFKEKLANGGREFLRSLRAVAYGFSAKSKVKIPGLAEVEASFVAKDMIDRAEGLVQDPLLSRSLYYEAFERLSATNIGKNNRIIVFVDDLDRCFPDSAIKLLESIKLVLSQPGFIFFLGVARSVIEGYLQHRYENEYGIQGFEGHSYLDKIVQLPFHIPPHTERIEQFSRSIVEQLEPGDREGFSEILPTIAATTGGNPRATIRFVNNLLIDRAINQALSSSGEMEPIPIQFFAITRTLQQRWQNIFSLLVTIPELANEVASWPENELSKYSSSDDAEIASIASQLLTDRELFSMLFSAFGRAWLQDEVRRSASISFLRRRRQETKSSREEHPAKYDIFIVYSRHDRASVQELVERLTHEIGLKVFFDIQSIQAGQDWELAIGEAMKSSRAVLVCIGQPVKEGFINKEIRMALDIFQRMPVETPFVIPLILPGTENVEGIPEELKRIQWIDARNGIDNKTLSEIKRALFRIER